MEVSGLVMTITEFNYIESCLWFAISIVLFFVALKTGRADKYFKTMVVASITFFVFGISDIIEAQTGAWWRPLELLMLKGACVIVLAACFLKYTELKKSQPK
ncbi:hypothetical protein [Pseudoalteromonas luteoviolacea]|uniref:Uncharacterized protein n=1 Tax=Pseudoalteromonas luteoviolacea DSM 6061 TaxID=1365250 RepID=A0A166YRH3_9GAMM|nr:hypothetical protein [Pseudoalteromonas luteoviolacea]KZN43297.1 hypothetical protein N475_09345 [Pseudoalteromonas luteoviolacea DSM 6061]KZN55626.1 hypothetical protein N474_14660 [Pseudoalteromonas luteoviolacea CPMOR-2]MBE0385434.1 hypothetical protein [Pseudoalteromonas luteoviolacea DSM 6061]TQF70045.1 hypothetical protein FLM44_02830 [Pseudoalteromonas luteoviolacea]